MVVENLKQTKADAPFVISARNVTDFDPTPLIDQG